MTVRLPSLLAALAVTTALATPALAAHGLTPKDLVTLDRVSDPRLSPDGTKVIYDLRTVDYDANKAAHTLWIADLAAKDPAPHALAEASKGGASGARWSPDGKWIYFISGRSGSDQIWRTDAAGSAPMQVTKLAKDVGAFRFSPDGRTLVVAMSEAVAGEAPAMAKPPKATGVVYGKTFERHWDTWSNGERNHLFVVSLDAAGIGGAARAITPAFDGDVPSKPFGDESDFTVTPDGKAVVFSARLAGTTEPWSTNFDLWQVPLDGSAAPVNLTPDNKAWDAQPVFSPDGTKLAYRAMKRAGFEADRFGVMVRDLKTGQTREIDPQWDRSADSIAWSRDGKSIVVTAEDLGQLKVFSLDVATGKPTALTGDGHVGGLDVGAAKMVYAQDFFDRPAQLFAAPLKPGGKVMKITDHNAAALADIAFGAYEQFAFPGWNGETVHGYVVKPANYQEGQKYPVAFLVHGGPQGSFGNNFHYRWNAEAFAGAGYAVVMIDFHGSTGYGQAFTDAISQHWGDRPLEDLQKGWSYALGKYGYLDGDRACMLGGSYGGFMANWIAGVWKDPWKCIVNHDGIFDNRVMGYATEELWFSEWENGGTVYANPAGYEKFNPANHVADWSTPELIIHSAKDFRIPVDQGVASFHALQRKGVPSEFLYFPDENHWVLKPQNSVQWHETVFDWLNRWTGPATAVR